MAKDFSEQLQNITDKTRLLMIRYQAQREKVEELTNELQQFRAMVVARDAEIEKLRRELEYLRIATTIAPDRQTKEEVYAVISNLVREIDRCVADLKD